jgi:hypothetical protein
MKCFFPLRRLNSSADMMREVLGAIERGELVLTKTPIETIDCGSLSVFYKRWLDDWTAVRVLGVTSLETLPYAIWWFQQHGQKCGFRAKTAIWSEFMTHRVQVGRPSLKSMLWIFKRSAKVERQCLIPAFRAMGPNELLEFERASAWPPTIA